MRRGAAWAVVGGLVGLVVAMAGGRGAEATPPRPVLLLPFRDVTRDAPDAWLGHGLVETLYRATHVTPVLLAIDPGRVATAARAEGLDLTGSPDRLAAPLARVLGAQLAFYGEYERRSDGGVVIAPKLLDSRVGEPRTLEPVVAGPGQILDRQARLIALYVRALELDLATEEVERMVAAARPTASLPAFEAFVGGRRAYNRGVHEGYEIAAEHFSRGVELDPTFALCHYHLGRAHLELGNRWKAAAQFRAAIQVDPMIPDPFKALGDLFMSSPRRLYDQAIEAYQRALAIRPHYAEAEVGLGDAKAAKGDYEGAIAHYERALAGDPLNARVHYSLGKIYYTEKNLYYESVTAYKTAIELDPFYLDARMGLGEVYEEKGLYKEAIAEYQKVIEADPRHAGAQYNLAHSYEKVDVKEAIAQWERYIELASETPSEKEWVDVARQHVRKLRRKLR